MTKILAYDKQGVAFYQNDLDDLFFKFAQSVCQTDITSTLEQFKDCYPNYYKCVFNDWLEEMFFEETLIKQVMFKFKTCIAVKLIVQYHGNSNICGVLIFSQIRANYWSGSWSHMHRNAMQYCVI